MGEKKRILITGKTYPHPSTTYKELVCTGGVIEDGTFIRLYPVSFRYRPYWQWYKKYQWIEVDVEKNVKDPRPETFRPVTGAEITVIGNPLSTSNKWSARKKYVLAQGTRSMCELQSIHQIECSMGIIKPSEVFEVVVERDAPDWPAKYTQVFNQMDLFGDKRKPLDKIPYKFSFRYKCTDPNCRGHKQMNTDWEVGALFLKERRRLGNDADAAISVKDKLMTLCGRDYDTHFYVGTVLAHNSYIVVGMFCPKL